MSAINATAIPAINTTAIPAISTRDATTVNIITVTIVFAATSEMYLCDHINILVCCSTDCLSKSVVFVSLFFMYTT